LDFGQEKEEKSINFDGEVEFGTFDSGSTFLLGNEKIVQ